MIKKIKQLLLIAMSASALLAPVVVATAGVASADYLSQFCSGVNGATGSSGSGGISCTGSGSDTGTQGIASLGGKVVDIFSIIVGIVAVAMIIFAGFRYITSGGDSGKVGGAKNALIYAIVGLVVVALAQVIVRYVLHTSQGVTSGVTGS